MAATRRRSAERDVPTNLYVLTGLSEAGGAIVCARGGVAERRSSCRQVPAEGVDRQRMGGEGGAHDTGIPTSPRSGLVAALRQSLDPTTPCWSRTTFGGQPVGQLLQELGARTERSRPKRSCVTGDCALTRATPTGAHRKGAELTLIASTGGGRDGAGRYEFELEPRSRARTARRRRRHHAVRDHRLGGHATTLTYEANDHCPPDASC